MHLLLILLFRYGKHYVPNICLKLSASSPDDDTESDDSSPLDLRSPTQRERLTSLCSSSNTATAALITGACEATATGGELTTGADKETEEEDEEILDVDSSPDDEQGVYRYYRTHTQC